VHPPSEATAAEHDVVIAPLVGPEVITGSTRMKAGTATKMVLNMISTAAMVQTGKVYGNLMVDLQVTCQKLQDRGERILMDTLGVSARGRRAAGRGRRPREDGDRDARLGLDAQARAAPAVCARPASPCCAKTSSRSSVMALRTPCCASLAGDRTPRS
jgi:hypothetical protein